MDSLLGCRWPRNKSMTFRPKSFRPRNFDVQAIDLKRQGVSSLQACDVQNWNWGQFFSDLWRSGQKRKQMFKSRKNESAFRFFYRKFLKSQISKSKEQVFLWVTSRIRRWAFRISSKCTCRRAGRTFPRRIRSGGLPLPRRRPAVTATASSSLL